MAKSKAELENELRIRILNVIVRALEEEFDTDVMATSTSEVVLPCVDSENNEKYGKIKVSIPRGTRENGTYVPYDGYAEAEDWKLTLADRADKAAKREEKREREAAEKERKRAAKQTIKTMKKDVQEILPSAAKAAQTQPKPGGEMVQEVVEAISA